MQKVKEEWARQKQELEREYKLIKMENEKITEDIKGLRRVITTYGYDNGGRNPL